MIITALVALTPVTVSPLDLMYAFYQSNAPMSVSIIGEQVGVADKVQGHFKLYPPHRQSYSITFRGFSTEFRQNESIVDIIEHANRSYEEYQFPLSLYTPPQDSVTSFYYPEIFQHIRKDKDRKIKFVQVGTKVVDNTPVTEFKIDSQQSSAEQQPGQPTDIGGTQKPPVVSLDQFGRIMRYTYDEMTEGGVVSQVVLFKNYSNQPADAHFPKVIEKGYVLAKFPSKFPQLGVRNRFPAVKLTDASTNQAVSIADRYKGKMFAILVTAPDCGPSKKGEPAWQKLAKSLKGQGCELIEISLSATTSKQNGDRKLYFDKSGEFENASSLEVTPFLLLFDKNGISIQGWAGYGPDQDRRIIDTFTTAIKEHQP